MNDITITPAIAPDTGFIFQVNRVSGWLDRAEAGNWCLGYGHRDMGNLDHAIVDRLVELAEAME